MKKKTILLIALCCGLFWGVNAQQNAPENETVTSIAERLNLVEKKSDKLNIYFNFQSSFDAEKQGKDGEWTGHFKARHLRLEIKGNLTDRLFYRFRHRLNKSNVARSLDNLSSATDMLYAGYKINDKVSVVAGKLVQAWGGYEYDLNPIYVYEFSNYDANIDCFMLGAGITYNPNKNNEFIFQVTDSRNDSFRDIYGDLSAQNIQPNNFPLTYILNWNGNLFNNLIKTRWAAGLQTDAKDCYTYTMTLGTQLNLSNFQFSFDYMMDKSDLDRLLVATNAARLINPASPVVEDVKYDSFIAKAEYQPNSKWNFFVKGTYETEKSKNLNPQGDNLFRKSYGYYTGIEYIPFEDQELRLFLLYFGKKHEYAKDLDASSSNFDTNRISLGMIYRIKAF